jgi:hypothetical protein
MQSKQYLTGTEMRVAQILKGLRNEIGELWVRTYWTEVTRRLFYGLDETFDRNN